MIGKVAGASLLASREVGNFSCVGGYPLHLELCFALELFFPGQTRAGCSRHLDLAPLRHQSGSSAPTAHSKSAQGNALGRGNSENVALKGRPLFGAFWVALSGLVVDGVGTQGVALGYRSVAPSGRQSARRGAVSCAPGEFQYGKNFWDSGTGAGCSPHCA